VIADQLYDRTRHRAPHTFFEGGIVAHIGFADPFCPALRQILLTGARAAGATVHDGGTMVVMEGPQFSTRAESNLYRGWGGDVIGMTNLQEAKLAREAELCFSALAMATDYDCWRGDEDVAIEDILAVLSANSELAKKTVGLVAGRIDPERTCTCRNALDNAIITDPACIPEKRRAELSVVAGRVMKGDRNS
jgi:5'-methylthioadenosine phosphorylase